MAIPQTSPSSIKNSTEPSCRLTQKEGGNKVCFKEVMRAPSEHSEKEKGDLFTIFEEEEEEASGLQDLPCQVPASFSQGLLSVDKMATSLSSVHETLPLVFEKMAGTLIVMHSRGDTETTLYLDHPEFASSPFFGARITIKEFSTAPKIFNVEISSSPTALLAMQKGKEGLLSLLARGDFGFSVHRLEVSQEGVNLSPYPEEEKQDERQEDKEP